MRCEVWDFVRLYYVGFDETQVVVSNLCKNESDVKLQVVQSSKEGTKKFKTCLNTQVLCFYLCYWTKSHLFPLFYISKSYFCMHQNAKCGFWHQGHLSKKGMCGLSNKSFRNDGNSYRFLSITTKDEEFFPIQLLVTYFWMKKKGSKNYTRKLYVSIQAI